MRCFKRFHALVILTALVLMGGGMRQTKAELLTPSEKSLEALEEAVIMTSDTLVSQFGLGPSRLDFSGNFSGFGWTANMSGTYLGRSVNLSFISGIVTQGVYEVGGTVAGSRWSGNGNWAYTDTTPTTTEFLSSSNLLISPGINAGRVVSKSWFPSNFPPALHLINDDGTYLRLINGVPASPIRFESSAHFPTSDDLGLRPTFRPPLPNEIALASTFDLRPGGTGFVSGTIQTIPEPPSLVMGGIGALGLMGYGWHRHRRAA